LLLRPKIPIPAEVHSGTPAPLSSLISGSRVARLAFLTPTNLAFLEAVGAKKIVWLFGFFFSIFGFLRGSWHMQSEWCFGFLYIMLKCIIRLF